MWIVGAKRGKFAYPFWVGTPFSSHTTCHRALWENCIISFTKISQKNCFTLLSLRLTVLNLSRLHPQGVLDSLWVTSKKPDSEWLRAGRPSGRSSSPGRVKNFLFSTTSRPALGSTQPPIQWVPRALSPGAKRPGREADHSTPASDEVKKMWIYTSTPPYAFS
jgi:hypothetical protein